MPGIYIASIITTIITLTVIGMFIIKKSPREILPSLTTLFIFQLPMCALAFYAVRKPIFNFLMDIYGKESTFVLFLRLFDAPLFEEFAKLLPLFLIPSIVKKIKKENALFFGLALGLGFGVGEIWFVGHAMNQSPQIATLPWYHLSGFINERFMVCLGHAAFTTTILRSFNTNKIIAFFKGIGLHFFANAPIFIMTLDPMNWGAPVWQIILLVWSSLFFIGMMVLLIIYYRGWHFLKSMMRMRGKCPECFLVFDRGPIGLNLVNKRYEKCPQCQKWVMTTNIHPDSLEYSTGDVSKAEGF